MIQMFSDVYKDAYGFRPRWNFHLLSKKELSDWFDTFDKEIERINNENDTREAEGIVKFEYLVKDIQRYCSCDKRKAIKYLMDAENVDGDYGFFEYLNNLPYGYIQKVA